MRMERDLASLHLDAEAEVQEQDTISFIFTVHIKADNTVIKEQEKQITSLPSFRQRKQFYSFFAEEGRRG